MSFFDLAMAWRYSPATGNAFLVHMALADMAIDSRVCATQAEIAILARCSVPTVSRVLPELIEAGCIEIEAQGGGPRSPIYRLAHRFQNDSFIRNDVVRRVIDDQTESEAMPQRIPFVQPNDGESMDILDQARRDMMDATGISDVLRPPNVYKNLARAIVGRDELSAGLQNLLRAMGTEVPEGAPPLYWCRDEHVEAYRQLLSLTDNTPAQLLAAVQAAQIRAPKIRTLQEINDKLSAANIIPF